MRAKGFTVRATLRVNNVSPPKYTVQLSRGASVGETVVVEVEEVVEEERADVVEGVEGVEGVGLVEVEVEVEVDGAFVEVEVEVEVDGVFVDGDSVATPWPEGPTVVVMFAVDVVVVCAEAGTTVVSATAKRRPITSTERQFFIDEPYACLRSEV
jgi:hypothetical protein